jgi:hypothetical protein
LRVFSCGEKRAALCSSNRLVIWRIGIFRYRSSQFFRLSLFQQLSD